MKKINIFILIAFLVLLDQGIKLYIKYNLFTVNFYIIGEIVQFIPKLNEKYSWINSLFDLGIDRTIHILIVLIITILLCIGYRFLRTVYTLQKLIYLSILIAISGSICSLIDKVFWGGSLDYISIRGFFIFDLKDIYITIFEIICICSLIFNDRDYKSISTKKIYYDFKQYIKSGTENIRKSKDKSL